MTEERVVKLSEGQLNASELRAVLHRLYYGTTPDKYEDDLWSGYAKLDSQLEGLSAVAAGEPK